MVPSLAATATCPAKLQRNARENDQMEPPPKQTRKSVGYGRSNMECVGMLVNGVKCMIDRGRSLNLNVAHGCFQRSESQLSS